MKVIQVSKVFEVVGSIYATSKGFMLMDDFGNLVFISQQTQYFTADSFYI